MIRFGSLDYCFKCKGTLPREMVTEFQWLFGQILGLGVHHKPTHRPGVLHPVPDVGTVAAERALYLTERVDRAVSFMLRIIDLVCDVRLATTPEVRKVASDFGPFAGQLRDKWINGESEAREPRQG